MKITQFKLAGTPCFKAIHPVVTRSIQSRFDAYHQSGMPVDRAMEMAATDHLKALQLDRTAMVADINRQLRENYAGLLEASTQEDAITYLPYSAAKHTELFRALALGGPVSVDTVQQAFKSLIENEASIKAELNLLKKDELLKKVDSYRYKNENKESIVKAVYSAMMSRFAYLDGSDSLSWQYGQKIEDIIQKRVDALTPENLKAYAEANSAAQAAYKERMQSLAKSIKDPETYEEFASYFSMKRDGGIMMKEARKQLTLEQREKFDALAAAKSRETRRADQAAKKTDVTVAAQTTDGQVIETKHTKTGEPLFVVKAADRVDREIYNQWNATAKRLGGWYSAFRGNGAVPGFQFKERSGADAFLKFLGGDTTEAKEKLQERRDVFADDRSQSAVERLNEMAGNMEERASEELNRDRKANTAKRAGQAASAIAKAERDIAMAQTMKNLAGHIDNGNAAYLDKVRTKAQIEMLESFANQAHYTTVQETMKDAGYDERENARRSPPVKADIDAAEYPTFTAYRSDLARLGREMEEIDGAKKLGADLTKVANDVSAAYLKFAKENLHKVSTFAKTGGTMATFGTRDAALAAISRSGYKGKATVVSFKRGEHLVVMGPEMAKEAGIWLGDDDKLITLSAAFVEQILAKNKSIGKRNRLSVPWTFDATQEKRVRLKSMGIETGSELREALREYLTARETAKEPDKVKELERSMVGRKNDGLDFFPTPPSTSQEMIDAADIQEDMSILEPSAGMGHISDQIRAAGFEPDVVEMASDRRELLEAKGYNLVGHDFMSVEGQYDRIIMNPPFSNRRDAEHVQHAYTLLKPGGRIVAIMGEGVFFGQDKKAVAFREWLDSIGGTSEKLADGTFLDSSLPVNTGVNARMVVIDKAENRYSQSTAPGEVSGLGNDTVTPRKPVSIREKNDLKYSGKQFGSNLIPMEVVGENGKMLQEIGKAFGTEVRFFSRLLPEGAGQGLSGETHGFPDGFVRDGKNVYLNVDSNRTLLFVVGHEIGHQIETNDPELYNNLLENLKPYLNKDRFEQYIARLKTLDSYKNDSDAMLYGEIVSDMIGELFVDKGAWDYMAEKNPSLFSKLANIVISVLNKIKRIFSEGDAIAVVNDSVAAQRMILDALAIYAEKHGEAAMTPEMVRFAASSGKVAIIRELDKIRADLFKEASDGRKIIDIKQEPEGTGGGLREESDNARRDEARGYFTSNQYGYEAIDLASTATNLFEGVRQGNYDKAEAVKLFQESVVRLASKAPEYHAAIVELAADLRKAGHTIPTDTTDTFAAHLFEAIDEESRLAGDYQLDTTGAVSGDVVPAPEAELATRYSVATPEAIKRATDTLAQYGTPFRLVKAISEALPRAASAMNYLFSTPVFQGERDAQKRKAGDIGITDFVDTGINRSRNNMEFQLEMMGWDGPTAEAPTIGQRLKDGVTQWESNDTSTKWGRIQQDVRKNLDKQQQAALDVLQREGDIGNQVYETLADAMKNSRIAATKPTQATFDAYTKVRNFIDIDMANARESLIRKLGEATGADKKLIDGTVKAYRAQLDKIKGWMPRKHGEGSHQVNVYHTIKELKFINRAIDGGHVAALPFYAGNEVAQTMGAIARAAGLTITKNSIGAPIVKAMDDADTERIQKRIDNLQRAMDKNLIVENMQAYDEKMAYLQAALEASKRPADVRIQEFIDKSATILPTIRKGYEADMQNLRDELKEATAKGAHKGAIQEIRKKMTALGDGQVKVKVYMRLNETQRQAEKLKDEVAADMKKTLDHVYHEGEEYTASYKVIDPVSEGMYGDMAGDFAAENIMKKAIDRAKQTGKIENGDARELTDALFRNYADVMLARGAGRHQIKRAPYLIQGYDQTDTNQIYHDYMTGAAGMLSKAMYAKQQFDNYRYAPADIKPWAERYTRDTLRNMGYADRMGGNVRAVATFMYLGFKVSSILVNGTQTWTLGVAELGRRTKQNSVKAVGKAQLDILKNRLSADESRIFNDVLWKEQEMATAIHEMSGQGEGNTGKVSKFVHTLVGKSLLPFQEMEMLNRRTMVLASYRSFLADGMDKDEALAEALDVNRKTNFEMSRANLPAFAHNPAGRTVYALQSFVWNNWNWLYNRATSGEKADMLALLKYGAMLSAIGGAAALAGGDEINKIIRRLTGKDYKLAMQVWTHKHAKDYGTAGELLNAMMWHGGMGALGVNISNAMRLNIPMSGFITGESTAGEAAMGIWSGIYTKGMNTARYASRGDTYKAIESAAPAFIEAPMKAARMMNQGATTSHGKPVLDEKGRPLKYSGLDAAKRAVGLQPTEQSFRSEVTQSLKSVQTVWSEKRGELLDRLRVAKGDDRKDIMKDVMRFNRDVRQSQAFPVVNIINSSSIRHSSAASKPDKKKMQQMGKNFT